MLVLNWTGLIVNGLVAFLLPMYLVLRSLEKKRLKALNSSEGINATAGAESSLSASTAGAVSSSVVDSNIELTERKPKATTSNGVAAVLPTTSRDLEGELAERAGAALYVDGDMSDTTEKESAVRPLPAFLEPYRRPMVIFMIVAFGTIMLLTIINDIVQGDGPPDTRRLL